MSKAAYPYPADEFDAAPDPVAPRGVHRAPRSAWSRWWPFLLVIVLVPVLAWGAVTWMADHGGLPNLAVPGVTETPADTASADASGAATPSTAASAPAASNAAPSTPATSGTTVDKTVPVKVLNASGVAGAAATAASKLAKAGFTSVTAGNATATTKQSVVYYATAAQQPAAALAASTLGIGTVTQSSAQAGTGITVVLG